ncbi:MAG TPA: hypothetical protein VFA33_27755 [Bryobacteraceae bacterium]|nr:hypothetical protein [Bryobacteraceae bacterium]
MRSLAVLLLASVGLPAQEKPFLETFFAGPTTPELKIESVAAGYLARPAGPGRLPGVLVLAGSRASAQQWTRELAGTGFAALSVAGDPARAADWLAAQPFADPQRLAAIAWPESAAGATGLARGHKLAALVVWGAAIPEGLGVPTLGIPAGRDSEQAWTEVYEFLGQHVEDASPQVARVVDIMRVINSSEGVRGQLARSLVQPPATPEQWEQARSRAAILAEAGNLLLSRHPRKGDPQGWKQRAIEYRDAATGLLKSIQARDFPGTQQSLGQLTQACADCHAAYR